MNFQMTGFESWSLVLAKTTAPPNYSRLGSDCGLVGRVVASNSRGPQFKSSNQQKKYVERLLSTVPIEKTKIKKKDRDWPI